MTRGVVLATLLYAAAGVVLVGYFTTPAYFAAEGPTVAITAVSALIVWTVGLTWATFTLARWRNRTRSART